MYDPQREELFTIRDDVVDPSGQSDLRGQSLEYRLDHGKLEAMVRWQDKLLTVDVYERDGQTMLHLFCPKCRGALRILSTAKRIYFSRDERRLDVEQFKCTYPGCDWRVHIDRNVAKNV